MAGRSPESTPLTGLRVGGGAVLNEAGIRRSLRRASGSDALAPGEVGVVLRLGRQRRGRTALVRLPGGQQKLYWRDELLPVEQPAGADISDTEPSAAARDPVVSDVVGAGERGADSLYVYGDPAARFVRAPLWLLVEEFAAVLPKSSYNYLWNGGGQRGRLLPSAARDTFAPLQLIEEAALLDLVATASAGDLTSVRRFLPLVFPNLHELTPSVYSDQSELGFWLDYREPAHVITLELRLETEDDVGSTCRWLLHFVLDPQELLFLKQLWDMVGHVKSKSTDWMLQNFKIVDAASSELLTKEAKKMQKQMKLMPPKCKSTGTFNGPETAVMMTALALVVELRNPAMRERHWRQLLKKCMGDPDAVDPGSERFFLKELLAPGLRNYVEGAGGIVGRAAKELQIERGTQKTTAHWGNKAQFTYEFNQQFNSYLLGPMDVIVEGLQEHLNILQSNKFTDEFQGCLLGKGGFAERNEATNCSTGEVFALPAINKKSLTKRKTMQKLQSGAKILSSLPHKNVVWVKGGLFVHEEEGKGEEDRPQDDGFLKVANPGAACVAPEQRAPAPGAAPQRKEPRRVLQQLRPNMPTAAVDRSGEGLLQLRVLRERARALQEQHDGLLAQRRAAQAAAQQQKVLLAQKADRAEQQTQRWREEAERWKDTADQDQAKLWAWLWVAERAEDLFGRPGSLPPHQAERELRQAVAARGAHGSSAVDHMLREGMLGDPAPAPRQGWLQSVAQRAWTFGARLAN